jgi:hypothetical protein
MREPTCFSALGRRRVVGAGAADTNTGHLATRRAGPRPTGFDNVN